MFLRNEVYTNENGVEMICDYYGYIDEKGNEVITSSHSRMNVEIPEPITPQPTQLDRIEEAVNKSHQDIIDEYTLSLIEEGVI